MSDPRPPLAWRVAALTAVVVASGELLVIGIFGPSDRTISAAVGPVVATTVAALVGPKLQRLFRTQRPAERPLTARAALVLLAAYTLVGAGAAIEGALWLPHNPTFATVLFADTALILTLVALAYRLLRRRRVAGDPG